MEIYLNGQLIHENADSLEFFTNDGNKINHLFAENSEYLDSDGEPFTVKVILNGSKDKDYEVRKCLIVRPEEIYIKTLNKKMHNKSIKVYLNS